MRKLAIEIAALGECASAAGKKSQTQYSLFKARSGNICAANAPE
jgi:hypothetical protein